jgi:hypothetical protein
MNHLFTVLNGGVFLWLVAGVFLHRRHTLHMLWMTAGFALDTALLLYIELDRGALEQTFGTSMTFWLAVHIVIATVLVFWYPMLIFSGGKVSAGKPKTFHKRQFEALPPVGRFPFLGFHRFINRQHSPPL